MKKILLLLFLINSMVFSQITNIEDIKPELIGEVAPQENLYIKCQKYKNEYLFTYRDFTYVYNVEIKTFSFKDLNNDFENFYNMIVKGLDNKPEKPITLQLPNGTIKLKFEKMARKMHVQLVHSEEGLVGYSAWLNNKMIQKLFGKK